VPIFSQIGGIEGVSSINSSISEERVPGALCLFFQFRPHPLKNFLCVPSRYVASKLIDEDGPGPKLPLPSLSFSFTRQPPQSPPTKEDQIKTRTVLKCCLRYICTGSWLRSLHFSSAAQIYVSLSLNHTSLPDTKSRSHAQFVPPRNVDRRGCVIVSNFQ
jgi:hypothetical protein